jgi:hypothetical protein
MTAESYNEAKAVALARHQVSVAEAHRVFDRRTRHVLAEAVTKADRDYHSELRELAARHGVTIFTGAYPTT